MYLCACANRFVVDHLNNNLWYVLRVTYQRELIAQDKLKAIGIDCFVPTQKTRSIDKKGRLIWKDVAALHNYIFVHSTREKIDSIKREYIPWLRYLISPNRENGSQIMTVPARQMESFIAIAGNKEERILYLNPDELNLTNGDRVRVIEGPFKGAEGVLIKIKNKRDKCVVVKIDGVAAVATASIPQTLVEKINNITQ